MANISYATQSAEVGRSLRILWEAMGDDDTGLPVSVGERPDGSVQAVGTFGSATVTLQGTNDGTNWVTMTDELGNNVTFAATGLKMFLPRVWKIRAITTGGSGTDVDVFLLLGG